MRWIILKKIITVKTETITAKQVDVNAIVEESVSPKDVKVLQEDVLAPEVFQVYYSTFCINLSIAMAGMHFKGILTTLNNVLLLVWIIVY